MSRASDATSRRALRHVPNAITVVRMLLIPVIGRLLLGERYVEAFWMLLADRWHAATTRIRASALSPTRLPTS
jgi:phosphatidylglycerophosphate synthase